MSNIYLEKAMIKQIDNKIYELIDHEMKELLNGLGYNLGDYHIELHNTIFSRCKSDFENCVYKKAKSFFDEEIDIIFEKVRFDSSFFSNNVINYLEVYFEYHDLLDNVKECIQVKENDFFEILEIKANKHN